MIILQCVSEKKKLRIKFYSYIDSEGKQYQNVYNNDYNCQFPKDIRVEGRFFSIGDEDLHLQADNYVAPFYKVTKRNIIILTDEHLEQLHINKERPKLTDKEILEGLKIYDVAECIICLVNPTSMIFVPCAHRAVCEECYGHMKKCDNKCPLCRRNIINSINGIIM